MAAKTAQQSDRRADYTLSLKPRHVGDACASAQALACEALAAGLVSWPLPRID